MELYKRYILPIFIFAFATCALAGNPAIKTGYVYALGGESLRELLESKVGIPKRVLDEGGYFENIKRWNASIENTASLMPGERIYVEIPYEVALAPKEFSPKPPPINKETVGKTVPAEKTNRESASFASNPIEDNQKTGSALDENDDKARTNGWNHSLFYALSRGSLQEGIPDSDITTESNQDSPLTLGFSTFKKLPNNFHYSGSLYLSKLDGGLSNRNESVSLPLEYGLNSYAGYQLENWPLGIYTGLDYERFSSYNTEELPSGEPLAIRAHTLTFLTVGASNRFEAFGKQFLAKASFSRSIMSSQSRPSKVNPKEFEGTKFILYLNVKAGKDWFYHGFYKQHDLEGATSLHISRVGFGFGYTF